MENTRVSPTRLQRSKPYPTGLGDWIDEMGVQVCSCGYICTECKTGFQFFSSSNGDKWHSNCECGKNKK
jgi:hypothetical protein